MLDAFLTETKSGYCQHFSGAMALLLRMGGVPARVVTGFAPGGHSDRKDAWIVRDTDAHSWVEAWFDEFGWVTLDPTPPATPARSQIAALTAPPEAGSGANGDAPTGSNPRTGGVRPDLLGTQNGPGGAGAGASAGDGGIPTWLTRAAARRGAARRRLVAAAAALAQPSGGRAPRPARGGARRRAAAARAAGHGGDDAAAGRGGAAADAAGRGLRARAARRPLLAGGGAADARRSAARSAPHWCAGRGPIARVRAFWSMPPWRS